MFIGHFAIGMAMKSQSPRPSLATWFVAAQFLDLLWPPLLLLGVEDVKVAPGITAFSPLDFTRYPISHSLFMALAWSGLAAAAYFLLHGDRRTAIWIGVAVASHWLLDVVTHRPDLPLLPGGDATRVGLGLWNSVPATLLVEGALFAGGSWLYLRSTRARDAQGRWGTWGLIAFLLVAYLASSSSAPPPDAKAIGIAGLAMWVLVGWAGWADSHRAATSV